MPRRAALKTAPFRRDPRGRRGRRRSRLAPKASARRAPDRPRSRPIPRTARRASAPRAHGGDCGRPRSRRRRRRGSRRPRRGTARARGPGGRAGPRAGASRSGSAGRRRGHRRLKPERRAPGKAARRRDYRAGRPDLACRIVGKDLRFKSLGSGKLPQQTPGGFRIPRQEESFRPWSSFTASPGSVRRPSSFPTGISPSGPEAATWSPSKRSSSARRPRSSPSRGGSSATSRMPATSPRWSSSGSGTSSTVTTRPTP